MGTPLNFYLKIIMLGTVLFIAYNALKQKEIFPINKKHRYEVIAIENEETHTQTSKRKVLQDEKLTELTSKLDLLMREQHLYLHHDINLASLSEEMGITPHQLSYIINNGFHQNFFQFINTYRVDKAKALLVDKSTEKLTILGIAYESGFSSKTAFNTTFKKFTQQTPSEFKKRSAGL
jgi:AraC-like DNA-binding protein